MRFAVGSGISTWATKSDAEKDRPRKEPVQRTPAVLRPGDFHHPFLAAVIQCMDALRLGLVHPGLMDDPPQEKGAPAGPVPIPRHGQQPVIIFAPVLFQKTLTGKNSGLPASPRISGTAGSTTAQAARCHPETGGSPQTRHAGSPVAPDGRGAVPCIYPSHACIAAGR